jgi:hypothetical protein
VLIEPMALESHTAAAEAVKKQAEALLGKFLCIPDPAAAVAEAGGEGGGSIIDDGLPKAGDGGHQGDGGASS